MLGSTFFKKAPDPFIYFFSVVHTSLALTSAYLKKYVEQVRVFLNFNSVSVSLPYTKLIGFIKFVRLQGIFRFSSLVDIFFYDRPTYLQRFGLVYVLRSRSGSELLQVRTAVKNFYGIFSVTSLFANAG